MTKSRSNFISKCAQLAIRAAHGLELLHADLTHDLVFVVQQGKLAGDLTLALCGLRTSFVALVYALQVCQQPLLYLQVLRALLAQLASTAHCTPGALCGYRHTCVLRR